MVHRHMFYAAALFAAFGIALPAQQAPAGYHSISCVRVKPGESAAFRTLLAGDYHKLEQARVDSGAISAWIALRTIIPACTDAGCDWVLVSFYPGLPAETLSDEQMTAALQKAGIASSLGEWRDRVSAVGELVSNHITQYQVLIGGTKKGDYLVFNSMSAPNAEECAAVQKKLWQPVAESAVHDGAQDGWAVNIQTFPWGGKDPSPVSTVDIFPTWDAVFNYYGPSIFTRWNKVHPDLKFEDAIAQMSKACAIDHTVLYKVEDQIAASK